MSHPLQDQVNSAQGVFKGERKSRRRQLMKHVLPARLFRWNCEFGPWTDAPQVQALS